MKLNVEFLFGPLANYKTNAILSQENFLFDFRGCHWKKYSRNLISCLLQTKSDKFIVCRKEWS